MTLPITLTFQLSPPNKKIHAIETLVLEVEG